VPGDATKPLVLVPDEGDWSGGTARFGSVAANVIRVGCDRAALNVYVPTQALLTTLNHVPAANSEHKIKARLYAMLYRKRTYSTAAKMAKVLKDGYPQDLFDTLKADRSFTIGFRAYFPGVPKETFLGYLQGALDVAGAARADLVAAGAHAPIAGKGHPTTLKATTLAALGAQTYNGIIHWYGHGNATALLLYKAYNSDAYWPLPVSEFKAIINALPVKPTQIILNACNTGNGFAATLVAEVRTLAGCAATVINAPTGYVLGGEMAEFYRLWDPAAAPAGPYQFTG
jgi:hypothetical protein